MKEKDAFQRILEGTSLGIRLDVSNEMAFIDLITTLGYRENKAWTDEEDEILSKLIKSAREHTKHIITVIEEWEKHGRPVKEPDTSHHIMD